MGKLTAICLLMLSAAMVLAAAQPPAKVAGVWKMKMQAHQGPVYQTMTLEQNGEKIKGTIKAERGEGQLEGTVKGNKIEFTVKRKNPYGEFTEQFQGTVEGDSMRGTMKMFRFAIDWTAERQK
jgi:hypothetical protein